MMWPRFPGLAVCLSLLAGVPLSADEKSDKLLGTWVWKAPKGSDQYWTITVQGGTWVVTGWYQKDGTETGTFVGNDVKYADGVLTFTHKYIKRPPDPGQDNAPVMIKAGNTLTYHWGKDYTKGPRTLVAAPSARPPDAKAGGVDPTTPTPKKREPKKEDRFVGTWKGTLDNHDQVWTVKHDDGVWSVRGTFSKNGVEVGSFAGLEVKVADDTLSFKRKLVKKPTSDWPDQIGVVARRDGVNLVYTYTPGTNKSRVLEPYNPEPPAVITRGGAREPAKFQGVWEGQVEQFHTVWDIRQKDGKWQLAVEYFSRNAKTGAATLVGGYVGIDPEIKDGNLVFETKFLKKPTPGWMGGKITCKLLGDDSFEYVLNAGGIKKKPLLVMRVKK